MEQTTIRVDKTLLNRLKGLSVLESINMSMTESIEMLYNNYIESNIISHNLDGLFVEGDTIEFNDSRTDMYNGDIHTWIKTKNENGLSTMIMSDGTEVVKNGRECFHSRTVKRKNDLAFETKVGNKGQIK